MYFFVEWMSFFFFFLNEKFGRVGGSMCIEIVVYQIESRYIWEHEGTKIETLKCANVANELKNQQFEWYFVSGFLTACVLHYVGVLSPYPVDCCESRSGRTLRCVEVWWFLRFPPLSRCMYMQ